MKGVAPQRSSGFRPKVRGRAGINFWEPGGVTLNEPEEVSHMAVFANLDEPHLRNTAESWADDAESRNGRRLPHNSGYNEEEER